MSGAADSFIVQVEARDDRGWFDRKSFADRDAAQRWMSFELNCQKLRIAGNGGTSYTGERPQRMRLVEVLSS